jgi:hypothetical protein
VVSTRRTSFRASDVTSRRVLLAKRPLRVTGEVWGAVGPTDKFFKPGSSMGGSGRQLCLQPQETPAHSPLRVHQRRRPGSFAASDSG